MRAIPYEDLDFVKRVERLVAPDSLGHPLLDVALSMCMEAKYEFPAIDSEES